jgi:hypothetical protein
VDRETTLSHIQNFLHTGYQIEMDDGIVQVDLDMEQQSDPVIRPVVGLHTPNLVVAHPPVLHHTHVVVAVHYLVLTVEDYYHQKTQIDQLVVAFLVRMEFLVQVKEYKTYC